ncbi:hypothetical protein GCM10009584_19940 [Ornithinimicrobium humiphilum]|uniref:Uncharacterized protein n=1 Tax=Ornithinimicrobium humiphilum TaxID=125288 RepID=A0A543KLX3_9MICO|nr:hypothetical protein [Ornithinimicrobium humiphilum]TQM96078.1 hypothetical protein FB476_0935 [Ornithinimicrobium humiphilum]
MTSIQSLNSSYGDVETFGRIIDCLDLIEFLRHSSVGRNYKPSDKIPSLIKLTPAGHKFFQDLSGRSGNPKEARLATFLEFFREELLIDVNQTNIDALRSTFSSDIREKKLRHPFVQGPYLYDAACELFPDLRRTLAVSETRKLLEGTPVGVYQIGSWVSGPAGLLKSADTRLLKPSMRVPLQHCPDARCNTVHSIQLLTDPSATINQTLRQIDDLPDSAIAKDNEWERFLRSKLDEHEDKLRRPSRWTSLVWSLGDLLTPKEARLLCIKLGSSEPRRESPTPDEFAADLQSILLHTDEEIILALDELIYAGDLQLGPGEVRQARLNVRHNPSNPGVPQISRHGPRVDSQDPRFPLLQLRRLVEQTLTGQGVSGSEVTWLLRNVDGQDADDRIVQALERVAPRDLLRSLAFSSEDNFRRACEQVDIHVPEGSLIDPRAGDRDEAFLDALLWSLGFDLDISDDVTAHVRRLGAEIRSMLQEFHTTSSLDIETLRGTASNFYTFLEGALTDVIQFTWWALTQDHVKSPRPFAYRPAHGEGAWFALSQARTRGQAQVRLRDSGPAGLQAMVNGLDVLADLLENLRSKGPSALRDDESISVDRSGVTSVPFLHRHIFLDLLPEAQAEIIGLLRSAYATLRDSAAVEVRNKLMHFSRATVPSQEALHAVDGVLDCMQVLEKAGFSRCTWRQQEATTDQWGRRSLLLRSERGEVLQLMRPKPEDTRWFPVTRVPHYVVPIARFTRYDVLRFSIDVDSEHAELWSAFPSPRADWRLYEKPSAALQDNIRGGMAE